MSLVKPGVKSLDSPFSQEASKGLRMGSDMRNIGVKLHEPLGLLYNDFAVLVGQVYGELPFMILPIYVALERMDRTLLEASQDLVHWEIVTHLIPQLTGSPNYNITNGVQNYGNGVFASSLRYHNGTFYCVETPNGQNTIIFYSTNIYGPWQSNRLSVSAFDPGLYIETNGTGYIVTAGGWQNNTTFLTLNSSFSQVVATTTITNGLGLEGSHVVKRGNYYYIFNAQPSTASLYVSRATNLFGPYTFMKSLDDGHGGHQGGIVDMPDGSDYGFVMKDSGTIGRMTYISPIIWSNNWPVWGTSNAPGRVPATARMPIVGAPAYAIAMHPEDLVAWQAHPEWLSGLVQVMGQAAWDEGLAFESGLRLSLLADPNLPAGTVSVVSIPQTTPLEQTGVMASGLDAQKENSDPRPHNAFLILENGSIFPLRLVAVNIGRRLENHLVIDDPRVSRSHAQLRAGRGTYTLFDLNSTGGTYVNSQRISQHTLRPGDVISLAGVALIYGEDAPFEPPPTHEDTAVYPSQPNHPSKPGDSDS